jgi:hypothetical protein
MESNYLKGIKKNRIVLLIFSVLILVSCYYLLRFAVKPSNPNLLKAANNKAFNISEHTTVLLKDSFVALAKNAYNNMAIINEKANKLNIEISGVGAIAKDFYAGNVALLNLKEAKDYFTINYNEEGNTTLAIFTINNNTVTVPNDVIVMMMNKVYNTKNTPLKK